MGETLLTVLVAGCTCVRSLSQSFCDGALEMILGVDDKVVMDLFLAVFLAHVLKY